MHHAEQPSLPRVVDHRIRQEPVAGGDTEVSLCSDAGIDISGRGVEVNEAVNNLDVRH